MNFNDYAWDRGCCTETLQLDSGNTTVLITHTFADDSYRIEQYISNVLALEKLGLTRSQAEVDESLVAYN